MIKGVVFDFDGTLVDSMKLVFEALNVILRRKGLPEIEAGLLGGMAGLPLREIISGKMHLPEDDLREIEKDVFDAYSEFCKSSCQLLPSAENTLKGLKSMGLKLGVLTTTPRKPLESVVKRFALQGYFDIMLAMEDAKNKPNPDGLEQIIREFGISKDECLYVGDSPIDVLTGKAAGVRTIAVTTGITTLEQLKEKAPDAIITDLQQLLTYVN